jgi:hypothetical protein
MNLCAVLNLQLLNTQAVQYQFCCHRQELQHSPTLLPGWLFDAGYTVVTTASPRSAELVKSYGADAVFDYSQSDVGDAIAKQYPGISMAVDCFSEGQSFSICDSVLSGRGRVITLLPPAKPKSPTIKHELIMSYTLFGQPFQWLPPLGPKFPSVESDRSALARFCENYQGSSVATPLDHLQQLSMITGGKVY